MANELQINGCRPRGVPGAEAMTAGPIRFRVRVSAWVVSLVLHAALILVMGLVALSRPARVRHPELLATALPAAPEPSVAGQTDVPLNVPRQTALNPDLPAAPPAVVMGGDLSIATADVLLGQPKAAGRVPVVVTRGGGLAGRAPGLRAQQIHARGGNGASEAAVARGLRWLIAHQLDDGSWRFDLRLCPQCRGRCRNWGSIGSTTAATALALLPFLGAGNTHRSGYYRDVVQRGLYYLTRRMIITPRGGDLQEGTMYAQGLAAIALCEAYAMTGDKSLRTPCQSAIDFIVAAQHKRGGWRYIPGEPGDTTVTGWQVMALKSAQLAGLKIPLPTWYAVARFLDGVQTGDGAYYGYLVPEKRPATTAIGLLCRMYLGWPRDHRSLVRGVEYLAELGPSPTNMYFDYYATQVLFHYDGTVWQRWNVQLRNMLVASQATTGHEAGSWQFNDPKTKRAGRLYNTAMAIMILEVYYRYMPLYGKRTLEVRP